VEMQVGVEGGVAEVAFSCLSPTDMMHCSVDPARSLVGAAGQSVRVLISARMRAARLPGATTTAVRVNATMLGQTRSTEIAVQLNEKDGAKTPRIRPRRLGR
jgi:hypothetical protein